MLVKANKTQYINTEFIQIVDVDCQDWQGKAGLNKLWHVSLQMPNEVVETSFNSKIEAMKFIQSLKGGK